MYYLATVKIDKIEFTTLIKANDYLSAVEIAVREYPKSDGYIVDVQITLQ